MSEPIATTPHQIRCTECDKPMRWRRGLTSFDGDYSIGTYVYECQSTCQTEATVTYRTFIPIDVARMRDQT